MTNITSKNTIATLITIIVTSILIYYITSQKIGPIQAQAIDQSNIYNKLDNLATILEKNQLTTQEQLLISQNEQEHFYKLLKKIDTRLKSVETSTVLVKKENNDETNITQEINKNSSKKTIKHSDIGHWMDESLIDSDATATTLATEQLTATIADSSGLIFDDMQCATRFCRASFTLTSSDDSAIQNLFGLPPFTNSSFSIYEANNRVKIYFTQPNASFDALRDEAIVSRKFQ